MSEQNKVAKNGALFDAIANIDVKGIKKAIANGADVNAVTLPGNQTALHLAVHLKNPGMVEELLKAKGIDVNAKDSGGDTALNLAVRYQLVKIVEMLSSHQDIQVDVPDSFGVSALDHAQRDKSSHGKEIRFVLAKSLGKDWSEITENLKTKRTETMTR